MKFNVHLNLYNFDLLLEKKMLKILQIFLYNIYKMICQWMWLINFKREISKIATNFTI